MSSRAIQPEKGVVPGSRNSKQSRLRWLFARVFLLLVRMFAPFLENIQNLFCQFWLVNLPLPETLQQLSQLFPPLLFHWIFVLLDFPSNLIHYLLALKMPRAHWIVVRFLRDFLFFPFGEASQIHGVLFLLQTGCGFEFRVGVGFVRMVVLQWWTRNPCRNWMWLHLMVVGNIARVYVVVDVDTHRFLGSIAVKGSSGVHRSPLFKCCC